MFDVKILDPEMVKAVMIKSPGAKFVENKVISLSKIYFPPSNENNVRVNGKDPSHVQLLASCLSQGIDYAQLPPIVYPKHQIIDGVHYDYVMVAGWHRVEAMKLLEFDRWIFSIYLLAQNGVSLNDSYITLQALENNHVARKESGENDIANAIGKLLHEGSTLVSKEEQSIKAYVDYVCSNKPHQTKSKIVRMVVLANGVYQDTVTYTANDAFEWIAKNTDYTVAGKLDSKRKQFGWTVREGYEYEYMVSAAKKFAESNKKSYFLCHTKSPSTKQDVTSKRNSMLENIEEFNSALLEVYKYYDKTGEFPWNVEGFLPQDKKLNEDSLIKVV
jgi:hypothetical protein